MLQAPQRTKRRPKSRPYALSALFSFLKTRRNLFEAHIFIRVTFLFLVCIEHACLYAIAPCGSTHMHHACSMRGSCPIFNGKRWHACLCIANAWRAKSFCLVCFALGPWLLVRAWLLHGPWLLVLDSSMVLVHARLFHGVQCIPQLRLCATNSNFLNYICFIYIYICVCGGGKVGLGSDRSSIGANLEM